MTAMDYVARAEALAPLIREHADDAERQRRLPRVVANAMSDAGLYRIAASAEQLGGGADAVTQIKVIEAVSRVDGSTGWNLMIGIETYSLMIAGLMRNRELIEDPRVIIAGSTASVGKATPVDGGYRVSGHWKFVSGCHNAGLFGGLVNLLDDGPDAPPPNVVPSMAMLPAAEIEILDTWHVSGLRGSGSHDVVVENVFVPTTRILAGIGTPTPSSDHMPRNSRLAYNKVGVALGIARSAIDTFVDLAGNKIPRFTSRQLRDRGFAQRAVAEAEVRLRAGRALVFELVREMWAKAQAGETIHREEIAMFQIACSASVRGCIEAVDHVAQAAGTSANPIDSPLERPIRDVRVVGQHLTVAPHHIEDGGRLLLGVPAQEMMLAGFNPPD